MNTLLITRERCTLGSSPGVHSLFLISSKSTLSSQNSLEEQSVRADMLCFNPLERTHFWNRVVGLGSSQSERRVTHAGKIRAGLSQSTSNCLWPRRAFPLARATAKPGFLGESLVLSIYSGSILMRQSTNLLLSIKHSLTRTSSQAHAEVGWHVCGHTRWKSVPNNHGDDCTVPGSLQTFHCIWPHPGVVREKSTGFARRQTVGWDFGQLSGSLRSLPSSFVKWELVPSFCRWGNWSLRISDLPKVT